MDVYINGQMVPVGQAAVGVDDAGFQHAVGLFETMSAYHGRVFQLTQHLERLAHSARVLGLLKKMETAPLAEIVNKTLTHNNLSEARIRLTVTAGGVSMLRQAPEGGSGGPPTPEPTLLIETTEPVEYDPKYFEEGITVLIAPPLANPFDQLAGHKTLAYWGRLRALRQAASAGAGEAIVLNVSNHLAGGAVSNIFLVRDGQLLTPFARGEEVKGALPAPVLPGITRAAVIELAEKRSIEVMKRMLSVTDLLEADEVFLTNSSWQILPVSHVEKRAISSGKAGPVTKDLRADLLKLIEEETTSPPESPPEIESPSTDA